VTTQTAKEPLSRERILTAAVAIADAGGIRAITMRRVAEELDCEAMSLYYYVDGKNALLAGLAETVIAEVVGATATDPPGVTDWRQLVAQRCLTARQVMQRHPWAPQVTMSLTEAPPITFAIYEQLVGTLVESGHSYQLAHRSIHALGSMVLGFTQELFEPDDAAGSEMTVDEMQAMAAAMPHLAAMTMEDLHASDGSLSQCDTQAEFEFTLGLILDGLERRRDEGAGSA